MPYQFVAEGTAGNLQHLEAYQGYFPEGSEGILELELRSEVAADVVGWLADKLKVVGVPASSVRAEGRFVQIGFRTEIAPLILIAGAIAACIFVMGMILAWKLWRSSPGEMIKSSVWIIALVIGGIILLIWLIKRYGWKLGGG